MINESNNVRSIYTATYVVRARNNFFPRRNRTALQMRGRKPRGPISTNHRQTHGGSMQRYEPQGRRGAPPWSRRWPPSARVEPAAVWRSRTAETRAAGPTDG